MTSFSRNARACALAGLIALAGCGGGTSGGSEAPPPVAANEARDQDKRVFIINKTALEATLITRSPSALNGHGEFTALPGTDTSRWVGVYDTGADQAAYQIEVPKGSDWNGKLVMWAHGYHGEGAALTVAPPPIRKWLIDNGYAWAASSYSKNSYDVRAGIEDTNALALSFTAIAAKKERKLAAPSRIYIVGESMGGHVAAAAIDEENIQAANYKVRYHGAVSMCGALGDTELFDYFAAYQLAAQQVAGVPATTWPVASYEGSVDATVRSTIWSTGFPSTTSPHAVTAAGDKLRRIVRHLTGGPRPLFDFGFLATAGYGSTPTVWSVFGGDGTVNGILGKNGVDTRRFVYQLDDDPGQSAEEAAFNAAALRVQAEPGANRGPRIDGMRWIPKANGNFAVPVVSLHTLGDMYVPFSMEQIFKKRADALGTSGMLVQRAIRGGTHCDFTLAEQEEAFADMARWEREGIKPLGDDVLTPATVAEASYSCKFSRAPRADDTSTVQSVRGGLLRSCPAGSASPNF